MLDAPSECKRCGECCSNEIPLTLYDLHRLARLLDIPPRAVFERYIQAEVSPNSSLYMIRKHPDHGCIFLNAEQQCTVHDAKPRACEFYLCNLVDREMTQLASKSTELQAFSEKIKPFRYVDDTPTILATPKR